MPNALARFVRAAALLVAASFAATGCSQAFAAHAAYGLGRVADPAEIARLDIDVAPDGAGLPPGAGEPVDGQPLFAAMCLRCHGSFVHLEPERWAYATSVFDYVRRAMPPDRSAPLTADETYALTAYLLYANGEIGPRDAMGPTTLPHVAMPRVKDFITAR